MTLQRTRSVVTATLLSVLVLLATAMPAPGTQAPMVDGTKIAAAADGVQVLVSGAADDARAAVEEVGGAVIGSVPLVGALIADVPADSVDELASTPGVTVTENVPVNLQASDEAAEEARERAEEAAERAAERAEEAQERAAEAQEEAEERAEEARERADERAEDARDRAEEEVERAEEEAAEAVEELREATEERVEDRAVDHPADTAGAKTLGADRVWRAGYDGSGVGIAVIDTGVTEVGDLDGRVVEGVDLTPEQDGQDNYGHGTPVATAAAGDGTDARGRVSGVAPGAHIVPVKIAGRDGESDLIRFLVGMDWIARHAEELDIRVVNVSLGADPAAIDLMDAAVQQLWDRGLVVVVAAGNGGEDSLGTPGHNNHAITVGSTQGQNGPTTNDDVLAPWSASGLDTDGVAKPDVVAPGQSVVVAGAPGSWAYEEHPDSHLGRGYQRVSGTSFSTGMISGAAALALDVHPDWTPDEVLGQLVGSGNDVDGTDAPTPYLPDALRTDEPVAANGDATDADQGPAAKANELLLGLGPVDPGTLAAIVGDRELAENYGSGWYGSGWYGSGWYATDWFGSGWYGSGWYGSGWYGSGWYGSGWYGSGWYGSGWYGSGWY